MLAARDQENLVFNRQNGAALKQQQKTPGARYPKTPLKVPLNDENARAFGGAKSIMGGRAGGNENAMNSKGGKGLNKSSFVTPSEPRARAVLGDKTTNAKARGMQAGNVKSAIREIEKTQMKAPITNKPKQKQSQVEAPKLQVHAEEDDPLSEEEPEYCPPRPKDLPYESDVFPDGALNFDVLKPENMFKGYYQHYFNPIGEDGISLAERELNERTKKALEEGDRRIQEDMNNLEWCIEDELDLDVKPAKKAPPPAKAPVLKQPATTHKPLSTVKARNAANAISTMDDSTKSLQRKTAKSVEARKPLQQKTATFNIPRITTKAQSKIPTMEKKGLEANSRTTIGYNKGRSTASILADRTTRTVRTRTTKTTPKSTLSRSGTTFSNDSDKTITPARYARNHHSAAAEDQEWRERVPFLSIFNPEGDDDCDLLASSFPQDLGEENEEEVELKIID
ncbi:hypothetical protein F5Y15DRAFT_398503 [Xylariaceae sp. FL0016]|nr:hypothetical protein F5Y15DRAFT_398503 [Xylariaceae sp. FL0016]